MMLRKPPAGRLLWVGLPVGFLAGWPVSEMFGTFAGMLVGGAAAGASASAMAHGLRRMRRRAREEGEG